MSKSLKCKDNLSRKVGQLAFTYQEFKKQIYQLYKTECWTALGIYWIWKVLVNGCKVLKISY